jgi:hypothetical protein
MLPTEVAIVARDSVATRNRIPKAAAGLEGDSHATAAAAAVDRRMSAMFPVLLSELNPTAVVAATSDTKRIAVR